jgi:hypothetical protein
MSRKDKAQAREKVMLATVAAKTPGRQPTNKDRDGPTPEQHNHATYVVQDIVDKMANGVTIRVNKAYRRQPIFETLWKQTGSGISVEGLFALRYYRARYEETEQSLTRCALDVQGRGGGSEAPLPRGIDAFMFVGEGAERTLDRLEQAMGAVADTVRAVALEDQSYSDVAIARWGSRKQSWIQQPNKRQGKAVNAEKIVPKSGRHREIIRQEFLLGLRRLVEAVRLLTASTTELRPDTRPIVGVVMDDGAKPVTASTAAPTDVDPEFLNEQGYLREWDEIAKIIRTRTAA